MDQEIQMDQLFAKFVRNHTKIELLCTLIKTETMDYVDPVFQKHKWHFFIFVYLATLTVVGFFQIKTKFYFSDQIKHFFFVFFRRHGDSR